MSSHSFRSIANHQTPASSASSTATMAETQTAPSLPPPPFLDFPHRRSSQAIQLPPLTIPTTPQSRMEQPTTSYPNPPQLPSIHSAPAQQTAPPPPPPTVPWTAQTRQSSGPAAPLANLLSPQPSTPSKSEPDFSPRYEYRRSPPRTVHESLLPRPVPHPPERYPADSSQHPGRVVDQPYSSPIEPPYRQHQPPIPSPIYTPTHAAHPSQGGSVAAFRSHPSARHGSLGSTYGPGPYAEPASSHAPGPAPPHIVPPLAPQPFGERSPLEYELRVRQQPIAARACGFGERDRRVIDPPPIIQLLVRDTRTGAADIDELRYSLNVVHCTLWSADGTTEETALEQPDRRRTRRLMGQLVASPSVAKDEHDVEGCFFCFPDLSCRTHGKYRLRFVLMRLDPSNLVVGGFSPILTDVLSDVFTVYTAKDFPGMRPSSALTRALKLQGCNIQVKKGNEKALARKRQSVGEADVGGEGDGDDKDTAKRRRNDST